MLKASRHGASHRSARARVKQWTRARFALPVDAAIFVSEVACRLPGCPPIETVVAFWTAADTRHHYKIFKPVEQVIEEDLPPAWMKNALVATDGFGCECC